MQEEGTSNPREYSRLPLGIPAQMETIHGPKSVTIIDISQGGAQLEVPEECNFKNGMLMWLDFEAFVDVTRRDGQYVGLKFEEPISHKTVFETRRNAAQAQERVDARRNFEVRTWVQGAR